MMETFNINGVEVFSVGEWNGDAYTREDLMGIVNAFQETCDQWPPFLKLGHDDDQKLLQNSGLPAAGWVKSLYMSGDKLMADFVQVPRAIYELIRNKAYRKVSCEIYFGVKFPEDRKYPMMLGAVALLGAEHPGVQNLSDILATYATRPEGELRVFNSEKEFSFENVKNPRKEEPMAKTEAEIKAELEAKTAREEAEKLRKDFAAQKEQADKLATEMEDLRKFRQDAEAREKRLLEDAETARREKYVTELVSNKLCSPSMKPLVEMLIGPDKKEYSHKEKNISKEALFTELLTLAKQAFSVNFEESSESGKRAVQADDEEKIEQLIQEKMAANKGMKYSAAYKAVLADLKNPTKE